MGTMSQQKTALVTDLSMTTAFPPTISLGVRLPSGIRLKGPHARMDVALPSGTNFLPRLARSTRIRPAT